MFDFQMLKKLRLFKILSLKTDDFIVFNPDNQLNWITTYFTIFNIILMVLRYIHEHRNPFPTIWT